MDSPSVITDLNPKQVRHRKRHDISSIPIFFNQGPSRPCYPYHTLLMYLLILYRLLDCKHH